jgi:hypothetical protein
MARRTLYPEGSKQLNVILPASLKDEIDRQAQAEQIPTSTLVVRILSKAMAEAVPVHA